jgi:5,10-methylenetetrahydrofolate reductase
VYDVQDESSRTSVERPFPFLKALDPFKFAGEYLQDLKIPKIIYRPAGKFSKEELSDWLDDLQENNFYPVFVGVPIPDFPVKTNLPEAYKIWSKHEGNSVIGAVTIPERHEVLKDEDKRILEKVSCGVSFFISQCVFNVAYAKQVVEDLSRTCRTGNLKLPTIIFTLTACGSIKTLNFLEWLGIHVPAALKEDLGKCDNMLEKSVNVCLDIASELADFCTRKSLPFGFNIESVAIRKEEIEASIGMVNKIAEMLDKKGIRKINVLSSSAV